MRGFVGRRRVRVAVAVCLAGSVAVLLPSLLFRAATAGARHEDAADVPVHRVAIVFGARVYPNGRPSPMLADRLDAALELYRTGRVERLLLTGDHSRINYDEVAAMEHHLVNNGVDHTHITKDHAGFGTYDSCVRAREIFGVTDAVLVTQAYHLPRAVYTCRRVGVEAVGLAVEDWDRHPSVMPRHAAREVAASLKAFVDVHVTRPSPHFLGPKVEIG